ncbi:5-formyltetrahydrofolate cyclo-ligase [Mycoplasmopsis agalactiae 14628]|uniref:5-formyltetrahydrofolate cyclo-ligase n=1 Tax=Mycoplasmopsis agalactiae 14628 TaxID=1110504 RepID=I5D6K2_MYCAA|nr:5-formyltetrahydrofolate cyclo-ligase [Mycoplasmopsis agalactiae]EIN15311.1 5-formyltetrahydrofolate cyclo-ligase [Mycoplasmopsis agalactiae 14628]
MNKNELRKLMITKRKLLTPEYKTKANSAISANVIDFINKNGFRQICIYLSTKYEADTGKIIEWCLHNNIKVYVPKVLENNKMVMTLIDNKADYQLNLFNINESKSDILCNIEEIDCIFTPLVAFDNSLNRIGMGKGFYDRFFSENNGNYLKVGICFDEQKVEKVEIDDTDQSLDFVITERNIYEQVN